MLSLIYGTHEQDANACAADATWSLERRLFGTMLVCEDVCAIIPFDFTNRRRPFL
jgi:hypothetical protein